MPIDSVTDCALRPRTRYLFNRYAVGEAVNRLQTYGMAVLPNVQTIGYVNIKPPMGGFLVPLHIRAKEKC